VEALSEEDSTALLRIAIPSVRTQREPSGASAMLVSHPPVTATTFDEWTGDRALGSFGTNSGAAPLAFQSWHRFKEAFSPEFVRRAIEEHEHEVKACLDPFGGSGTTALASQFLGVRSTTIEVNPFLVDVMRAKLATYDADALGADLTAVLRTANGTSMNPETVFGRLPPTFIEPGVDDRWLFSAAIAASLASLMTAIDGIESPLHRQFFRVVLGGMLIDVSNVVVSGKGRRYRRNWRERVRRASEVAYLFAERARSAITDVHRFANRLRADAEVIHGDARTTVPAAKYDLAIFSPPYPNSFDYTDVYNVELWMLGYLGSADRNRALREATLTSHVQLARRYAEPPAGSRALVSTLKQLRGVRDKLWSPWIPAMVGGYFADLLLVLDMVRLRLYDQGACWIVIGDSRYGGVRIPTAKILEELAIAWDWDVLSSEPFRAMRSSPQHGGQAELPETLLRMRV
jgi:hypothetical protein